ncbi:hypothetical protein ACU4GH_06330 [Bradyrhizobium betae]
MVVRVHMRLRCCERTERSFATMGQLEIIALPARAHAADFAVSNDAFARANPRLNPRGHPFHQHTDFKRRRSTRSRRERRKAGASDDRFRNEFCVDRDDNDDVVV